MGLSLLGSQSRGDFGREREYAVATFKAAFWSIEWERSTMRRRIASSSRLYSGLMVAALLSSCALKTSPAQMYDGPALPKEQIGIVRSACKTGPGLTITIVRIDGKDIPNGCADYALLPGEHKIELSAKRLAPRMDTPMIRTGSVLGAPPSPSGASASEELPVVWASTSPLSITCTLQAGEEVVILGNVTSSDWDATCQRRSP